jgi:hypothetical protein
MDPHSVLLRLLTLGVAATVALACCGLAVRRLDPAAFPATARTRVRWWSRHATTATGAAAAVSLGCLLALLLL